MLKSIGVYKGYSWLHTHSTPQETPTANPQSYNGVRMSQRVVTAYDKSHS